MIFPSVDTIPQRRLLRFLSMMLLQTFGRKDYVTRNANTTVTIPVPYDADETITIINKFFAATIDNRESL